ncbi:MAG: hypothetical protein K5695_02780 [Oscillospiraceae bacterium]|nr:hypothetical protein [Oscillospiraceae bacterium]
MKRDLTAIAAIAAACVMLVGCGKKPEQNSTAPADTAPAAESVIGESGADASAQDSQAEGSVSGDTADGSAADPNQNNAQDPQAADSTPGAENSEGDALPKSDPAAAAGALHVSIETVSISLEQLKSQDYTVPVLVTLDKNPGITYSEWGLHIDPKCTFTADSEECKVQTVHVENDEEHFLWTAWASGALLKGTGSLLEVQLKLPLDAKAGDTYTITYADTSLANKGDVWDYTDINTQTTTSYADMNGVVTWTDGGVKVTG